MAVTIPRDTNSATPTPTPGAIPRADGLGTLNAWVTGSVPAAHAATHKNGGSDEVATVTPTALAIPKAGAGGSLAAGWVTDWALTGQVRGSLARFDGTNWVNLAIPAAGTYALEIVGGGGTDPAWVAKAGSSLQASYNAGATIVTAGGVPIVFTLTSGGFTVNGTGTVNIGADATVQALNIGTGAAAKTTTIGSTTTNSSVLLQAPLASLTMATSGAITVSGWSATTINTGAGVGNVNVNAGAVSGTLSLTGATVNLTPSSACSIGTLGVATSVKWLAAQDAFWIVGKSTPIVTGNTNNWDVGNASTAIRVASTGAYEITGIVPNTGPGGRILQISNVGAYPLTFKHNSTSSSATRRMLFPNGDFVLLPEQSITLWWDWDGGIEKWRLISTSYSKGAILTRGQPTPTTSGPTTTSTTFVVLDEMTFTFTPKSAANPIRISGSGWFQTSADGVVGLAIFVDGVQEAFSARGAHGHSGGTSDVAIPVGKVLTGLSVASHTITLRWTVSTGTATAVGTERSLIVEEEAA